MRKVILVVSYFVATKINWKLGCKMRGLIYILPSTKKELREQFADIRINGKEVYKL